MKLVILLVLLMVVVEVGRTELIFVLVKNYCFINANQISFAFPANSDKPDKLVKPAKRGRTNQTVNTVTNMIHSSGNGQINSVTGIIGGSPVGNAAASVKGDVDLGKLLRGI